MREKPRDAGDPAFACIGAVMRHRHPWLVLVGCPAQCAVSVEALNVAQEKGRGHVHVLPSLILGNTRHPRALTARDRPVQAGAPRDALALPVLLLPHKGSWLPDTDKGATECLH